MPEPFRKLNDLGINRFRDFLDAGAKGPPPADLLVNPETSQPVARAPAPVQRTFENRYEFGRYLMELFADVPSDEITHEKGFWSAAALMWFELICPVDKTGSPNTGMEYRYILSPDFRHYYRHGVRAPWQLVRTHGEFARFLLIPSKDMARPLGVHGEILEQLSGRQWVLGSKDLIAAASNLYFDQESGRPKKGVAGSGRGSARRFGLVLRQYDLTYDPQSMPPDNLVNLLPAEFDRWRNGIQNKATATAGSTDGSAEGLVAYAAAGPETT